MNVKHEVRVGLWLLGVFLALYLVPFDAPRVQGAVLEAFGLAGDYAREHVLRCLVPALFIAGGIAAFFDASVVMRHLGPKSRKVPAYALASVSGTVLAVCSCTVLPLFAGIYRMGAGLGPACAFLYSGPAISVLAMVLTANVLGFELGVVRAVGAIGFSLIIGLLMHVFFRKGEGERVAAEVSAEDGPGEGLPLRRTAGLMGALVAILVLANWAKPEAAVGVGAWVYGVRWWGVGVAALAMGWMLVRWLGVHPGGTAGVLGTAFALAWALPEMPDVACAAGFLGLAVLTGTSGGPAGRWFQETWFFTKQILPLLLAGVLVSGFLLGRSGGEGVIPREWVVAALGGEGFGATAFAAVAGALMYFATLTEVPVVQGLLAGGMGKGPALALLLAGPALSLPSMLVLRSVMGVRKTVVYVGLVVVLSTVAGLIYGVS